MKQAFLTQTTRSVSPSRRNTPKNLFLSLALAGSMVVGASSIAWPAPGSTDNERYAPRLTNWDKSQRRMVHFDAVVRGRKFSLDWNLYPGLDHYQRSISPRVMRLYSDDPDMARKDWNLYTEHQRDSISCMRFINEPNQQPFIKALASWVRSTVSDKDDQLRLALSLVQHIPYDTLFYRTNHTSRQDYLPYQVLYNKTGVCGERSYLLAAVLRELDYHVVLMSFKPEQHMTVGIWATEASAAYPGTPYALLETTSPSIPGSISTLDSGPLSSAPDIIVVHYGKANYSFQSLWHDEQQVQALRYIELIAEQHNRILPLPFIQLENWIYGQWGIHPSNKN